MNKETPLTPAEFKQMARQIKSDYPHMMHTQINHMLAKRFGFKSYDGYLHNYAKNNPGYDQREDRKQLVERIKNEEL